MWSARRVRWAASDAVSAEVFEDGSGCLKEAGGTLGVVKPTYREAKIVWRALGPARTRTGNPRSSRPRTPLGWATSALPFHPAASARRAAPPHKSPCIGPSTPRVACGFHRLRRGAAAAAERNGRESEGVAQVAD